MNKRDPSTIFRIYSYIRNKSEITHGPPRGSAGFDPAGAGMPMPEERLTSAFGRSTREANMSEAKSAREKYRAVLVDALRVAEFRRRFGPAPEEVLAEPGVRGAWGG